MPSVQAVVVEDDEQVRWILGEVLNLGGITHAVASSGTHGLQLIEAHQPPLAILDLKLGGLSGLDVAHEIPRISASTRILFMTGYADNVAEKIHGLPVVGIMEKPFDVEKLLDLLHRVLDSGEQMS